MSGTLEYIKGLIKERNPDWSSDRLESALETYKLYWLNAETRNVNLIYTNEDAKQFLLEHSQYEDYNAYFRFNTKKRKRLVTDIDGLI